MPIQSIIVGTRQWGGAVGGYGIDIGLEWLSANIEGFHDLYFMKCHDMKIISRPA
jgi:hypothetical protein